MKNRGVFGKLFWVVLMVASQWTSFLSAQQLEDLDRGVVAVATANNAVFVSWRLLGTDDRNMAFNVYRNNLLLTKSPLLKCTSFTDTMADTLATYSVMPVIDGVELIDQIANANVWRSGYLDIPLKTPERYRPNDVSVGDLDGDGQYEIVLHMAGRGADNSQTGVTSEPIFQAYELDGTLLWEINLGKNIREGAHYTQFMVYDLDGDGKAEIAMKTADGTTDGVGTVIGDGDADWRNLDETSNRYGKILDGPEYFTIFNGQTGAAIVTTDYTPSRYPINGWGGIGGNGDNDNRGNRCDRFLACIAYLDGEHPSVVMCRGYYGRSVLVAWDFRDDKLTQRWVFDTALPGLEKFCGQGNHNITVADVDGDGKDEIIYGAMAVDDDGTGIYTTGLRHGDAIHVTDLDPSHPGLEVFGGHENEEPVPGYENGAGMAMYDAATGEILMSWGPGRDVGRSVAADIFPDNPGAELWGSGSRGLLNTKGEIVGQSPSSTNFLIWWDGDLSRELLNGNRIDKYGIGTIMRADGCRSNNGSKSTPALSADIIGDWREELILRTDDNKHLRIYSTTIPTNYRMNTLMHDTQYRLSVAWQNVGYNQPPHTSFYLGTDIAPTDGLMVNVVKPKR